MKTSLCLTVMFTLSLAHPCLAAEQEDNPLQKLHRLLGNWSPPEAAIERWPQLKDRWTMSMEWGSERGIFRIYEGRNKLDPKQALLEGMVYWDPRHQDIRFTAYNTGLKLLFEGNYQLEDESRIVRHYQVHYPADKDLIPRPDLPGWSREFREVYQFTDHDTIAQTVEIKVADSWEFWGGRTEPFISIRDQQTEQQPEE